MDGLLEVVADRRWIFDRHRVFGDRLDDRDDVDLLNAEDPYAGVPFQVRAFDLSRKHQTGHGVKPGRRDSGHGIGATRAGRHHEDAQLVGDLRICLRGDGGGLFMEVGDEFQVWRIDPGTR